MRSSACADACAGFSQVPETILLYSCSSSSSSMSAIKGQELGDRFKAVFRDCRLLAKLPPTASRESWVPAL